LSQRSDDYGLPGGNGRVVEGYNKSFINLPPFRLYVRTMFKTSQRKHQASQQNTHQKEKQRYSSLSKWESLLLDKRAVLAQYSYLTADITPQKLPLGKGFRNLHIRQLTLHIKLLTGIGAIYVEILQSL
jgi:hypothetical protein